MGVAPSARLPWLGSKVMIKLSRSPSTSEPVRVISTGVSSGVSTDCSLATGASFTGLTVMVTVAMLESAAPSLAL